MTKKNANQEGTFYKDRRSGLYRGEVSLPDGTRRKVSGKNRAQTHAKWVELKSTLSAGLPVGDTDTVEGFLIWWLGRLEAKVGSGKKSPNTADNARWAVEKWIVPTLGKKRLRDLAPEDVERLLDKMAAAGRSHRTIVRVKSYLGQALAVAQSRKKVSWNVATVAEMPETQEPTERRSLTPAEAKKVLGAAEGHRLEALFVTALMLGLRPGELTGLPWKYVDIDKKKTLRVADSLKRERGQLRVGNTKTKRTRTLDLPAPVLAALRVHRTRQKRERVQAGPAWRQSDLVFTTEVGSPIDPSNLRRVTKALCEAAGVEPVSPNELGRHSAASLLYDAGMSLEHIAELLGHASVRMLEAHYRHRVRESFGGHVGHVEAIFGN